MEDKTKKISRVAFDYEGIPKNNMSSPTENNPTTSNTSQQSTSTNISHPSISYTAAVKSAPKCSFLKKEQAIVIHSEEDLKLYDYVKSIGDIIGPRNICFASRISNSRICIYLTKTDLVEQLISTNPTITIGNHILSVRRLITPAKRLIMSNICPSIPNEIIEASLKNIGLQLVSPISFLRAGIPGDEYNHILSFRSGTFSSIDLSLCDPRLTPLLTWTTMDCLYDSNHFPILISNSISKPRAKISKWKLSHANWKNFSDFIENKINQLQLPEDPDIALDSLVSLITLAAQTHIGTCTISSSRKTVPWWNTECKKAIRESKTALNKYRRIRTESNLLKFKQLKAIARRVIKQSKKDCWNKYISSISIDAPSSQVWKKIKQMHGKTTHLSISALSYHNSIVTEDDQIAKIMAIHFHNKSKNDNYTITLTQHKDLPSTTDLSDDLLALNAPFTFQELSFAISTLKNSAAGIDNIPSIFLKNLALNGLTKLLSFYNLLWINEKFPNLWRQSIILPIKKPDKPSIEPSSYRPISLTCCMCKLMEKLINNRLNWFSEKHNIISSVQSGFRPHRSAMDNLVLLQNHITENFNKQHDTVVAAFDIENAFDTIPKNVILQKLIDNNITGNIYTFINNFLNHRKFKVAVNGNESNVFEQLNGVPQGSVLSPILFNLAINDISKEVRQPIKALLYADDLLIYCSGASISSTSNLIQNAVNNVYSWSTQHGIKLSSLKSRILRFTKKQSVQNPEIYLNDVPLTTVNNHKILGLIFDQKLNWKIHLKKLKDNCAGKLNILKTLAHHQWGAEENMLLRIYTALIRSRLDYGCILYMTACNTYLKSLNSIQTTSLRICLGAFRSSPAESLCDEALEPPLFIRRQLLLSSYFTRVSANPKNPVFKLINIPHAPKNRDRSVYPLPQLVNPLLAAIDLNITTPISTSNNPPWTNKLPAFNTSLTRHKKEDTPKQLLRQLFQETINAKQYNQVLYTDASKDEKNTGCAVCTENITLALYRLPTTCSIHTAELYGILKALEMSSPNIKSLAICTDSLSSIQSIANIYSLNPIVQKIQHICHQNHSRGTSITILWTPSHIGITGNESADIAARKASCSDLSQEKIQLHQDLAATIKQNTRKIWQNHWNGQNTKLYIINPTVYSFKIPTMTRRDKLIIRRLRIGHTRFTHGYLMTSENPPVCEHCDSHRVTVEHLLVECSYYRMYRLAHNITGSLKQILSSPNVYSALIDFLKDCRLYYRI
ncbi:uncharacterized protein [Diabrotica undecimpunctata]|uniref:uncharacterized protein n=1 Tax=Diabrotica undecimpunctata TaxID=50387 RepID=UPI003B633C81